MAMALFGSAARAQSAPPMPTSAEVGPTQKGAYVIKPDDATARPEGFRPGLAIGAQFQLADARSVVGQPDGTTITTGIALDATADYNSGKSEWRTAVNLGAGVTRTPTIDEFIKARDTLAGETIYLFHALPWLGPFARASLSTQMFGGQDVRGAPVDYTIAHVDGSKEALFGGHLELTDPFKPMTLKQSLGAFIQPLDKDRIRMELRAGFGAQEIFAKDQLAVTDDDKTPIVEVSELKNSYQAGGELVANAWGTIDSGKRVAYTLGLGVLIPFAYSDLPEGDTRGTGALTAVEFNAGLNVKLFEWASLDYKLAVVRQPLLVDATQITNNLLLTIGFGVGTKAPAPPPAPPKCEVTPAAPPDAAPAAPPPAAAPAAPPAPAPETPAKP